MSGNAEAGMASWLTAAVDEAGKFTAEYIYMYTSADR